MRTGRRRCAGEESIVEELWQRVSRGRHTALLGIVPGEPPAALGIRVVRVRCDVPKTSLGPLLEAQRKVDLLLGGAPPLLDQARHRVISGLRRRLLGDVIEVASDAAILDGLNRLAQHEGRRYALALDAVEEADGATLEALRRIVGRPDALRVPLVLSFRTPEPLGAAGALVAAVRAAGGPEAVLRAPGVRGEGRATWSATRSPEHPDEGEALAAEIAGAHPEPRTSRWGWRSLPYDVLRVLRAGALIGSGFEVDLLASLLEVKGLAVLEALQRAVDAGVPIEDHGEGRFHAPEPLLAELRESILPSLARAWHRRLSHLLSESEGAFPIPAPALEESALLRRPTDVSPASAHPPAAAAPAPAAEAAADEASAPAQTPKAPSVPPAPEWPYSELFPAGEARISDSVSAPVSDSVSAPVSDSVSDSVSAPDSDSVSDSAPVPPRAAIPDPAPAPARGAAPHPRAAADLDATAQRYCAAASQAAAAGAYPQALAYAQQALALLEDLPASPARRRLRVLALTEIARVHWQAAGPSASSIEAGAGGDVPPFTLAGALEVLAAARELLAAEDPPALYAQLAVLTADVCYDLGDMRSLARALDELTDASRRLLASGDASGAARLLNDQAAVYVRMGDPVRATHLLMESRKVFEQRAAEDPIALVEIAETDHLFARIPLHVTARPGREDDALSMGLDHALAAERTYKKIGAARELGRVWETMGRLELRKRRLDRATKHLSAALDVQQATGDLVGLARSTAALSEVLVAEGRHRDALLVLADSIALNREKGSPIGLAFNRRALAALAPSVSPHSEAEAALRDVAAQLDSAEASLGRLALPGEPG